MLSCRGGGAWGDSRAQERRPRPARAGLSAMSFEAEPEKPKRGKRHESTAAAPKAPKDSGSQTKKEGKKKNSPPGSPPEPPVNRSVNRERVWQDYSEAYGSAAPASRTPAKASQEKGAWVFEDEGDSKPNSKKGKDSKKKDKVTPLSTTSKRQNSTDMGVFEDESESSKKGSKKG
eukprot:SAG22_NODE_9435_length_589_cov_2.226531_1_plen_174_part_10